MKSTGMLITMDLYNCSDIILADIPGVETALKDTLNNFSLPIKHSYIDTENDTDHYSITIYFKESHLLMHCYPSLGFATIDILVSSAEVDVNALARALRIAFNPDKVKATYFERGDFGNKFDMKPRRKSNTKTVYRAKKLTTKLTKIFFKPKSL